MTRVELLAALRAHGGNRTKTAAALGIPLRSFHRTMSELLSAADVKALTVDLKREGSLDGASARGQGITKDVTRAQLLGALNTSDGDREKAALALDVGARALARGARRVLLQKDRDMLREALEGRGFVVVRGDPVRGWLALRTIDTDERSDS